MSCVKKGGLQTTELADHFTKCPKFNSVQFSSNLSLRTRLKYASYMSKSIGVASYGALGHVPPPSTSS